MATIEIKVPDIGDFAEVGVIEVLVQPGDTIKAEQSLITVESDKASMEIPSSHAGVVKELKVKLGDKIAEGSVLLTLETAQAAAPAAAPAVLEQKPAPAPAAQAQAAIKTEAKSFAGSADLECDVLVLGGGPGGRSVLAERYRSLTDDGKPVVEAQHLTKRFNEFVAVHDNSFSIRRGEIFGLLGPNGAGKSTTFKMMCGLLVPTSGKALVLDMDLKTSSGKARQHLGYMAQKFSLYGNLTVEQNLRFFSGVYGLRGRAQKEKIERMSEAFGLKSIASHATDELPLGFKQRLALACSLMHEPDILFLDEPTSGVDPLTRREFWLHINSMVEKGVTVMVTTHFMDEAEYCDRIGLVYRGKLIASGTPDDLKAQAADSDTPDPTMEQAFITLINDWDKEHTHE